MVRSGQPVVIGVFANQRQARRAVWALRQAGFHQDEIGFAMPSGQVWEEDPLPEWLEGSAVNRAVDEPPGTLAGLPVAAGWVPPVGPVVAGGGIASRMGDLARGAPGGLTEALTAFGLPLEEARYCQQELCSSHSIVTVRADRRSAEASAILHGL